MKDYSSSFGGGAAGYTAAQTIREDGFTGRLVLITRENHLPYDRPNLSKEYLQRNAEPGWLPLRSEDFFAEHDIEVIRGKQVKHIDAKQRKITFADDETLCVMRCCWRPAVNRATVVQSKSHENVFLLRSYDDCDAIISVAEKENALLLSAGVSSAWKWQAA